MVSIGGLDIFKQLEARSPLELRSLRVVPLVGPGRSEPEYRLFGPDTTDEVEVTEISESGSVPDLRVHNGLSDWLLLIDGQELVGAKQNRILNTDVLIAAGAQVTIPVSCVEQGRWGYRSAKFSSGGMHFSSARAAKAKSVHESYVACAAARADQGEVWEKVRHLLGKHGTSSSTAAMSDAYLQREADLRELRDRFEIPTEAIGVAVFDGERLMGLDLFDRSSTLSRFWSKLLDSYGMDFLAKERHPDADEETGSSLETVLDTLAKAEWEAFDSPGEGRDLRLAHDDVTASALIWEGQIVHLQAFPAVNRS